MVKHLDSKELKVVGVNFLNFSSDTFTLGGIKTRGFIKVVTPIFASSTPVAYGCSSQNRAFNTDFSNKVSVIKTVGNPYSKLTKITKKFLQILKNRYQNG